MADEPTPLKIRINIHDTTPVSLRMLAHPTLGATGISDEERLELLAAAAAIEHLQADNERLINQCVHLKAENRRLEQAVWRQS